MISSHDSSSTRNKTFLALAFIVSLSIIFFGIVATILIGNHVDANERERLLLRAKNAAILIEPEHIEALEGDISDLSNPEYEKLKHDMTELRAINTDVRFAYVMGLRNEKLFFFVDSEDPDSVDYSPPGEIYLETLPLEVENFKKGIAFVEGPYVDRWGKWVSGYAPISDPETGKTLAIIGLDISASYWQAQITYVRLFVGTITVLVCALLIMLMLYLRRTLGNLEALNKTNESLRASKEYLSEAERIAHIGHFSLNFHTNELVWNSQMFTLFGMPEDSKITPETLYSAIHPGDLQMVKEKMEIAIREKQESFTMLYRILLPGGLERKIYSVAQVQVSDRTISHKIIGTAQDLTNILV